MNVQHEGPNSIRLGKWQEEVPLSYRHKRARIAFLLGTVFSVGLWVIMLGNGAPVESFFVGTIPLAVGLWRCRYWLSLEQVTRYAEETVRLTARERLMRARKFLLFGTALAVVLLLCGFKSKEFFGGGVVVAFIAAIVACIALLRRTETSFTPEAQAELLRESEVARARESVAQAWIERVIAKRWIRYPAAGLIVWFLYVLSQDPTAKTSQLILLGILAAALAYDLLLWLLGALLIVGVLSLVFKGIAALPVGVAAIVGALIIASALDRR